MKKAVAVSGPATATIQFGARGSGDDGRERGGRVLDQSA